MYLKESYRWNRIIVGIYLAVFMGMILLVHIGCKKKISEEIPSLVTINVTDITSTSITSGGLVFSAGGVSVLTRGICLNTQKNPKISDIKTNDGSGVGSYTSSISGLMASTTYYVRAYATNSAGTGYGNQFVVTTMAQLLALTTTPISSVTTSSAISGGNITDDGGTVIIARGVCWSTTTGPTTANNKTSDGAGTGIFPSSITGLTAGTTYYVRAYATNSSGTSYGNEVTFTAMANLPTLTTTSITSITSATSSGGGNITSDGGSAVTARGVCWSTTTGPTTANNKTSDGTGTGIFPSSITGLTAGTTYYVRAYATNSSGTSYGNEVTFTAMANLPTLTTTSITSITSATSSGGGNITSDGGSAVTARGVCWSTTTGPTTANNKTSDGAGTGIFPSSITGLTAGTTYYVRAYATNSSGTSYGNEVTFTAMANLPTLTTTSITSITSATSSGGGNITSDGGSAVTARGVCWSTTTGPTTANNKTSDGTGTGIFPSSITGLTAGTTYYVRAYATNSAGTSYGNELTFITTCNLPAAPVAIVGNTTVSQNANGVTYSISAVAGATSYNWTLPTGASIVSGQGTTTITVNFGSTGGNVSVRSENACGNSIYTNLAVVTCIIPAAPVAISGSSTVAHNATGVTYSISSVTGATNYNWTVPAGATIISGQGTITISVNFGSTGGNVSVRSENTCGNSIYTNLNIVISGSLPVLTTNDITCTTYLSSTSGGNITSDGGLAIIGRGVCWGTLPGPTISNNITSDGTGTGSFISNLTGLTAGTVYYIRAYATNSFGTSYGNEIIFSTSPISFPNCGNVTDIDGNVYNTVTIGAQCWLAENLKTTTYQNGDPIPNVTDNAAWDAQSAGAYCWYNNDAATYKATYGAMYNWFAAVDSRNLCPVNWHVPTDAEWTTLTNSLGGANSAGGALKEVCYDHWISPNTGATNISGFTALPGGYRDVTNGLFIYIGYYGWWWTSTQNPTFEPEGLVRFMWYLNGAVSWGGNGKLGGMSVRCVRDF